MLPISKETPIPSMMETITQRSRLFTTLGVLAWLGVWFVLLEYTLVSGYYFSGWHVVFSVFPLEAIFLVTDPVIIFLVYMTQLFLFIPLALVFGYLWGGVYYLIQLSRHPELADDALSWSRVYLQFFLDIGN